MAGIFDSLIDIEEQVQEVKESASIQETVPQKEEVMSVPGTEVKPVSADTFYGSAFNDYFKRG